MHNDHPIRAVGEPEILLYTRHDCHLCEVAWRMLERTLGRAADAVCERRDIDTDPALRHRYGARIPVLRDCRDGRELQWPFEELELQRWLAVRSASKAEH